MTAITIFDGKEYPGPHRMRFTFEDAKEANHWQRICQMFVILLLTERGSVPTDPDMGTTFVPQLWSGSLLGAGQLKAAFDLCVLDVMEYLATDGYMVRNEPSARLGRVTLRKWAFDEGHAELWADFYDAEGTKIAVGWIPVNRPSAEVVV